MDKHTFTKFEFDVFWKSVKVGWDNLNSQDQKEMCAPLTEDVDDAVNDSFDQFVQNVGDIADTDSFAFGSDIEDDLIDCFTTSTRFEESKAKRETDDFEMEKKNRKENTGHTYGDDGRYDDAEQDERNPFVATCAGTVKYTPSSSDDETKYPSSSDDASSPRDMPPPNPNNDPQTEGVNMNPAHSSTTQTTTNQNSSSADETRLPRSSVDSKVTNKTNGTTDTPLTSLDIHSQETLLRPALKNCEVYNHVMDLKKEKIVFCNYQRIDPVRPDPVPIL
ncbi:unnamed protein product [Ambrosiozyma monospora]|uniref:Unnamed protein product n=1 Tax=Ambrosiozyma monospora TaxID=43982 RepID=A0ACB5U373_AMBMO|nr:unnamed protein product [Ambrosiozyma monospora]